MATGESNQTGGSSAPGTGGVRLPALRGEWRKSWRRRLPGPGSLAIFYAAYILAGGFGNELAIIPGVSITFWPPAGILIATLLLNPRRSWPWWVLTGCLAELTCNALWFHNPLILALVYYGGNALEGLTAAWLVTRFAPLPFRLESLREVAAFVVLAAGVAPTISATVIAVTDATLGKHPFLTAWPLVWLGDGTGLLVSAPLTVAIVLAWRERTKIPLRSLLEAAALALLLLLLGALALRGYLPTIYLTMPVLLWAAARYQIRGAAVALGLITLTTAAFAMAGKGEFEGGSDVRHKMIMLQVFLGISATSALVVGALSQLHQQALRELRKINTELKERVDEQTAELRESEGRLRVSDRRKDEFLATLAHELRNPLSPIRNSVQVLNMDDSAVPEVRRAREVIDRQVRTMARLVDDLMDVSRINQDRLQLRRERLDLAKLLHEAVDMSRPLLDRMGHRLDASYPDGPLLLDGDATRLTQVFLNLLNNAAKYTPPNGRIDLRAGREGNEIVVSVRDNGIGIPSDKLSTIFEMFSQVEDALSRSQGGLGIGLALVRKIVELHGGDVEVRSAGLGQGSEFVVRLPVVLELAGKDEDVGAAGNVPVSGLRILVVDDNADTADSLATLLSLKGNEAHTAYDGLAAVAAAAELRPRVILCDIGLPNLNGYEVCRQIRQQPWGKDMILVAITGWGQDEDKRKAEEAGFDHHMTKPVNPEAMMQLVARAAAR